MRKVLLVGLALLVAVITASALQVGSTASVGAQSMANVAFVAAQPASAQKPKAKSHSYGHHKGTGKGSKGHGNGSGSGSGHGNQQPPTHWDTAFSFSGNGSRTMSPFTVSKPWQLVWYCDPTSDATGKYTLTVTVISTTTSTQVQAVNVTCSAKHTSGTVAGPLDGSVEFQIGTTQLPDWWEVDVQVPSQPNSGTN